jgi:prepilin-type N-terminal cleavage/methylation domain-containing protein
VRSSGFSLIEVLVATTIVLGAAASLAPLFIRSAEVTATANGTTVAVLIAEQKMEELLAAPGPLNPLPDAALAVDTAGCVDYFDAVGAPLPGDGTGPPLGAMYVRRWSIETLPGAGAETIVLRVLVLPSTTSRDRGRRPARLVSVRVQ